MFIIMLVFSVSVMSAQTFVTCQETKQTGHGYYRANCSGNYVKMTAYYSSSSEKYFVNNYTGTNGDMYKNVVGVYLGYKNGNHSWNVGKAFNSYGHIHHFTVHQR